MSQYVPSKSRTGQLALSR